MLTSGAKNLMDKVGNGRFASGAGDGDEFEIANRIAVIGREKASLGALRFGPKGSFWLFGCFFLICCVRILIHRDSIAQKIARKGYF